jgi:hypothetical protein
MTWDLSFANIDSRNHVRRKYGCAASKQHLPKQTVTQIVLEWIQLHTLFQNHDSICLSERKELHCIRCSPACNILFFKCTRTLNVMYPVLPIATSLPLFLPHNQWSKVEIIFYTLYTKWYERESRKKQTVDEIKKSTHHYDYHLKTIVLYEMGNGRFI